MSALEAPVETPGSRSQAKRLAVQKGIPIMSADGVTYGPDGSVVETPEGRERDEADLFGALDQQVVARARKWSVAHPSEAAKIIRDLLSIVSEAARRLPEVERERNEWREKARHTMPDDWSARLAAAEARAGRWKMAATIRHRTWGGVLRRAVRAEARARELEDRIFPPMPTCDDESCACCNLIREERRRALRSGGATQTENNGNEEGKQS